MLEMLNVMLEIFCRVCIYALYAYIRCIFNKKLSYLQGTAQCVVSVEICQLPRNSAETTCTTSPEQIEVMMLKRYIQ